MAFLLDTVAISEMTIARPNPAVLAYLDALEPEQTYLSVVTVGEIRYGIERLPLSAKRRRLEQWLEEALPGRFSNRLLPVDEYIMNTWGRMMANLEKLGRPLPMADSLIAATALALGLTIVTRNSGDFGPAGVSVENPWEQ